MDGVHDLGGVQGFGPLDIDRDEHAFHHDWEARMWGLNEAMTGDPGWTIDWWRHVRELILPLDYLSRPYFDQWAQVYAALLIDSGIAGLAEVASGKAPTAAPLGPGPALVPPMSAAEVAAAARRTMDFRRDGGAKPVFVTGQRVRARLVGAAGHTRLPRYVRGRPGLIHAFHGNHLLPDAGAKGEERAEPLYTVAFRAADLWPEAAGSPDRIFLDLWESYLEP
jgi:nitrile hydratase subunit beta